MDKPNVGRGLPRRAWLSLAILFLLIPASIYFCFRAGGRSYYLASVLIILFTLVPFFLVFERRRPQARELVVIAVLCALAVASRAVFYPIPHFKPMTAIIILTGVAFGPEAGFLTGALSGFTSNFIFGQGPWTPWQMFAYGVAGFLAGALSRMGLLSKKRIPLSIFGFFTVMLAVGPLLDTYALFTMASELNAASAGAVYLSGIPVNLVHAAATVLTLFFFSAPLLEKLERIQVKYGMMEDAAP